MPSAPAPKYLGPGKDSGDGNKPIRRIVMHGTVSPTVEGGARNIAAYFRSANARGSAHYVVDPGETVQVVWDSRVAWHAPPNAHSIGVELCDMVGNSAGPLPLSRWDKGPHKAMLERAAKLVAGLCLAYDVPPVMRGPKGLRAGKKGICEHDDVSDAWGQSSHWDLGRFPRKRFARMVRAEIADLQGDKPKAAAEKKKANSRVTRARDLLEQAARTKNVKRRRRIKRALKYLPHH